MFYLTNLRAMLLGATLTLCFAPLSAQAARCFDRENDNARAGATTAVIGPEVGLRRQAADYRRPRAGDELLIGDRVRTGDRSQLQLKLCDWSTYTFAPNSESDINEFYDDDGVMRRRVVNFLRGGFRMMSGKRTERGKTEVRFSETGVTMGVRGTSVLVTELDDETFVVLEGPAPENSGLSDKGVVELVRDGETGGVILSRPGFAVRLGAEGVSAPFKADPQLMRRAYARFTSATTQEGEAEVAADIDDEQESSSEEVESEEQTGSSESEFESQTASAETTESSEESSSGGQTSAADSSGASAQEAAPATVAVADLTQTSSSNTENTPEEPSQSEQTAPENFNTAFPSTLFKPVDNIESILSVAALEAIGAGYAGQTGHFTGFVPAERIMEGPNGDSVIDQGVAFIQLHIDFAARSIWPEIGVSFIILDFTVSDPNDLTVEDRDFQGEQQRWVMTLGASQNAPFDDGLGGLAVFRPQANALNGNVQFVVRVATDANGSQTITLDVASVFNASTTGQPTPAGQRVEAFFNALPFQTGQGPLARFGTAFADIATGVELQGLTRTDQVYLTGGNFGVFPNDASQEFGYINQFTSSLSYGQLLVDFGARTLGGGQSFVYVNVPPGTPLATPTNTLYPGANLFISLDVATAFNTGLFNLGLFPISTLTSDPRVDEGQVILRNSPNTPLDSFAFAEISFSVTTNAGLDLYLLNFLFEDDFRPLTTVANLMSIPGAGVYLGQGFASMVLADQMTFLQGSVVSEIDIDFANRTLGGGNSFIQMTLDTDPVNPLQQVVLTDFLNTIPFASSEGGLALFPLSAADFTNGVIDQGLLLIQNSGSLADTAELDFSFSDLAGGVGNGNATLGFNPGGSAGQPPGVP